MFLFVLGLLLSIPLSIFANVYTPKVTNWIGRRNASRAAGRRKVLQNEYDNVIELRSNRDLLREYLTAQILRVTYIGALTGLISGLLFAGAQFINTARTFLLFSISPNFLTGALSLFGQLVAIIGGLAVIVTCSSALRKYNRVQNFDLYGAAVEEQLELLNDPVHK